MQYVMSPPESRVLSFVGWLDNDMSSTPAMKCSPRWLREWSLLTLFQSQQEPLKERSYKFTTERKWKTPLQFGILCNFIIVWRIHSHNISKSRYTEWNNFDEAFVFDIRSIYLGSIEEIKLYCREERVTFADVLVGRLEEGIHDSFINSYWSTALLGRRSVQSRSHPWASRPFRWSDLRASAHRPLHHLRSQRRPRNSDDSRVAARSSSPGGNSRGKDTIATPGSVYCASSLLVS